MSRCPNKNTAEYKALQVVYKTELETNSVIIAWQNANDTDVFPTVVQAQRYIKLNKASFSLKKSSFAKSILENLERKKLIHMYHGNYLINNSFDNSFHYDESALTQNHRKIYAYLKINNIPLDSLDIERTPKSYKVNILESKLTNKDILPISRAWDQPRSVSVVLHLKRMFPGVDFKIVSDKEAEKIHDELPKWKKTSAPFSEVNSFYVDQVAYLIKGRITDETAIEEMLHPFIDALKMENETLFNNLLAEAKASFPEMVQQITAAYNKKRNFNPLDVELEIVTQALSRHFNNEYGDIAPTKTFLNLIKDALEWFKSIINDLHKYITDQSIPVTAINSNATFTDIAKLLNTEDIKFLITQRVNPKVRYSLSKDKKFILGRAMAMANPAQKVILTNMFNLVEKHKGDVDSLSVSLKKAEDQGAIVVLNKEDHTYVDINSNPPQMYTSATTAIKGKLTNKEGEAILRNDSPEKIEKARQQDLLKLEQVQLNLDLGNDVDIITEAVVVELNGLTPLDLYDNTLPEMAILDAQQAREMFGAIRIVVGDLMPANSIAMSQVVVFDPATKIAGTADLIIIDELGNISILDLKTSKNSIFSVAPSKTQAGQAGLTAYESSAWTLPADSKLRQLGVKELSTKGQHNLQVNLYRRMFENMGYTVNEGDFSASTFHMHLNIEGNGKDQKFLGTWKYENVQHHNNLITDTAPSANSIYVDMLIPSPKENLNKQKLNEKMGDDALYKGKDDKIANETDQETVQDPIDDTKSPELGTIFNALEGYLTALGQLQRGSLNRDKVFSFKSTQEQAGDIAKLQVYITNGINKGPREQSKVYVGVLHDTLAQIREFRKYVADPKNLEDPKYISYVLNFNRFITTFSSLYKIDNINDLNATQRQLVLNLQIEYNKLIGTKELTVGHDGLINDAIFNYVKDLAMKRSNRNYGEEGSGHTEQDLIDELLITFDIGGTDLQARDMDTSPDMLSALIAQMYKSQKQKTLDRIDHRKNVILKSAGKLLRLSPAKDVHTLFNYMQIFGANGRPTGQYVKPIGAEFYTLQQELYDALSDEVGVPYEYKDIINKDDASEEDIEWNIKLAIKKSAFSEFSKAERHDENGNRVDGEYFSYTQEFKTARKRFEVWVNQGTYGYWMKRSSGFTPAEYSEYFAKYYHKSVSNYAMRGANNEFTGQIKKDKEGSFPKYEFKIENEWTLDLEGNKVKDMRSTHYKDIFDPEKTDALSIAQREFYELFVRYYEKELLPKLGPMILKQMTGKNPLVKNNLMDDIKNRPNIFGRMYADTTRSVKNFFTETATHKQVPLDENGNFQHGMPIFYTGSPRIDGALEKVENELQILDNKYKAGTINVNTYKDERVEITGRIAKIRSQPSQGEISTDLATSLIKFSAMAEHFEVMGEIEDTLTAIQRVIENREYKPSNKKTNLFGRVLNKADNVVSRTVGFRKETSGDSNITRRVRKFMSMIYYDDEKITKGMFDKIADGLISFSSLSYVAFNPFGNFNNYLMGRINNNIEMLGSRFFTRSNFLRASKLYNTVALPGIIKRTGTGLKDAADIATLGLAGLGKNDYDPDLANNKYEAVVDLLRMMDASTDIHESGRREDEKSIWERFRTFGYIMQDAAEYNVQTKVGITMVLDIIIKNETVGSDSYGETMSLYDAFTFNTATHKLSIKEGFNTIISKGYKGEFNDAFRYKLRNNIREVNKQIHGNYAREDRMVLQNHTIGALATQFKKWVAPAIRARFQEEYFDENLGWMEGRYKSWWKFLAYTKQQIFLGKRDMSKMSEGFLKEYGADGLGGNKDQRAQNQLYGFYRTMGEIGIIFSVFLIDALLGSILADDDDDSDTTKRLKHLTTYQSDRLYKELILFAPIFPGSFTQIHQMASSPIASTKILGNFGEVLNLAFWTPASLFIYGKEATYANSTFVYQNAPREGQLKVAKAWKDAMPILYTGQKWENALIKQDFKIIN